MRNITTLAIVALAFIGASSTAFAEIGLPSVPDAGTSAVMLATALSGLAFVRRFCKR